MAPGKKNACRLKAYICFMDESGFSQRPPVRSTWAPRGRTPIQIESVGWKQLSGIGTIRVTPQGHKPRWFLTLHPGSIRTKHILRFLKDLKRHCRRRVILVWDNLPAHRSKDVRKYVSMNRWLRTVYLPAYSPELNPVEPLWDYLDDTELANTAVEDLKEIGRRLRRGMQRIGRHPEKAQGFLRYTGLF